MIPEEKFNADFGPIVSFYAFHVKKKSIPISLNDIGMFGVNLEAKKHIKDIEQIDMNAIVPNAIYFSSSKKKHNVKNLMWYIRCSAHHPENIEIVNINGVEYPGYAIDKINANFKSSDAFQAKMTSGRYLNVQPLKKEYMKSTCICIRSHGKGSYPTTGLNISSLCFIPSPSSIEAYSKTPPTCHCPISLRTT